MKNTALGPLSRYIEYGVRNHAADFAQITRLFVAIYVPVSMIALSVHPSIKSLIEPEANLMLLFPLMIASQLLLRILQVFLFILLILRIESERMGDGAVWDIAEAVNRLKAVAKVDLAYTFGLQLLGVIGFAASLFIFGLFFGDSPIGLPFSFAVTIFLVLTPAVRYYFCTLTALLYGDDFAQAFRRAGMISSGGERTIVVLAMVYLLVWFILWQVIQGIFGGDLFGQVLLQTGVMVTSVSYYLAGYLLFSDLCQAASERRMDETKEIPEDAGDV